MWGFANGLPTDNSARIGWRSIGVEIALCAYFHVNGERFIAVPMDTVYPYEVFYARIQKSEGKYKVWLNDRYCEVDQDLKSDFAIRCYPYFGGKSTAPQTMYIYVK